MDTHAPRHLLDLAVLPRQRPETRVVLHELREMSHVFITVLHGRGHWRSSGYQLFPNNLLRFQHLARLSVERRLKMEAALLHPVKS